MKKVLVAGAALMLAGGLYASAASAAAVEPGVKITGDARVRIAYKNDAYDFNDSNADKSQTNMDSRVRLNFKGTAAGGAYAFARIRLMEGLMGDMDSDLLGAPRNQQQNNIWADQAFMGIPFNDTFTLEMGKYRSTYGPLPLTYNFFYDDVNLSGARGIVKTGNLVINPFVEWMDEAQNTDNNTVALDRTQDNDEVRFGGHLKYTINKDWFVGGMLGYQMDDRNETTPDLWTSMNRITANDGGFGSLYVNGKSGAFGIVAELAVTDGNLNGMNSWLDDSNVLYLPAGDVLDSIGSNDTGFGGYAFPNYTINKLNIGLNLGFTDGGFQPDRAYGFVMLGGVDNSWITAQKIGTTGDWMWAGLVATYTINESTKLTGNLVYADIDPWTNAGDGPSFRGGNNQVALDSAWELSAVLQYTISKGMDVYFSAGYLDPSRELVNATAAGVQPTEDAAFGALTRFELKF